jgi:hypothetical protein
MLETEGMHESQGDCGVNKNLISVYCFLHKHLHMLKHGVRLAMAVQLYGLTEEYEREIHL